MDLPEIPDDDADFTPDLARMIVAKYQEIIAAHILTPRGDPNRISEILKPYLGLINSTPELLSLLYDIDMLPEQTRSVAGAIRLAALCEVWQRGTALSPADGKTP